MRETHFTLGKIATRVVYYMFLIQYTYQPPTFSPPPNKKVLSSVQHLSATEKMDIEHNTSFFRF